MQYPSLAAMGCLRAMCCGLEVSILEDDSVAIRVPSAPFEPPHWVRFPLDAQEELTARGWLVLIGEDEIEVTEAGRHWNARFQRDQERKARKVAV